MSSPFSPLDPLFHPAVSHYVVVFQDVPRCSKMISKMTQMQLPSIISASYFEMLNITAFPPFIHKKLAKAQ